jgi:outer membrane protein assembly factor BamB
LLFLNTGVLAGDNTGSLSFKQCWSFSGESATNFAPLVQNNFVFLSQTDGDLVALDARDGSVVWRAGLGGEIITAPFVKDNAVFIASQSTKTTEGDIQKQTTRLRALSLETGVTLWQDDFENSKKILLAQSDDLLLFATSQTDGNEKLFALAAKTGEQRWTQTLTAALTSQISVANSLVYFSTADNLLHSFRISDGSRARFYKLQNFAKGKIAVVNGVLIFGDELGIISALRETDSRIVWKLRTGGAVQDILPTPGGVIITSLDNFVYLQNAATGKRRWRRRLSGRPNSALALSQDSILLLTSGESEALVLRLKNGKIAGQIPLGADNYATSHPAYTDNRLIIPTFNGLLSFVQNNAECGGAMADKEKSGKN